MLVLVTVPVTVGGAGLVPKAYSSACFRISSRRQVHSALVVISVPSSFLNGSGSKAMDGRPLALGSAATVQLAPSSSDVEVKEPEAPTTPPVAQATGAPALPPADPAAPPLPDAPPPASVLPPLAAAPAPPAPGLPALELLQARTAREASKTSRLPKVRGRFMAADDIPPGRRLNQDPGESRPHLRRVIAVAP